MIVILLFCTFICIYVTFLKKFLVSHCHTWDLSSQKKETKKESEAAQLCLTLCDPVDCSLPSSSVPGILQARIRERGAISFSKLPNQVQTKAPCIGSMESVNHRTTREFLDEYFNEMFEMAFINYIYSSTTMFFSTMFF